MPSFRRSAVAVGRPQDLIAISFCRRTVTGALAGAGAVPGDRRHGPAADEHARTGHLVAQPPTLALVAREALEGPLLLDEHRQSAEQSVAQWHRLIPGLDRNG